ncbi:porin family protein [Robiginitalea sp. SC105]|uniref:porin family protein n=1 Tax=Robiginitalea sp. SC105 TaxID=2762332 RepID=UPI00163AC020|nr:porin family protein [Robiginitalea sp. SC105]MBC2838300.1 PorT family protein [Robiginitalea sp. SC105]
MKKLFVFSLILVAFQLQAQDKNLTFGIKAGANFSNLKLEFDGEGLSPDGATSIFVGGFVDIGVAEKLNFQPEIQYSIEGAKNADVSFINVPLMLKYYLVEGFNIQAGPQIGFLVDAEGGTDGLKSTNFALNLGAAYELPAGFFVDARYNFGLSNIAEEEPGFEDVTLKTKGFQLGVGYRF